MQKESLNLDLKPKRYKQSKIETIPVFLTEQKKPNRRSATWWADDPQV